MELRRHFDGLHDCFDDAVQSGFERGRDGEPAGMYGVDQYILQYDNELGPPWKNVDPYLKMSYPFLHADKIKTPTLFMGGEKDFNVTLVGGEQMYQALKSVGTTAELIVYPGQFHGFTRPSFIRDRYQRWFDWYGKYLGCLRRLSLRLLLLPLRRRRLRTKQTVSQRGTFPVRMRSGWS